LAGPFALFERLPYRQTELKCNQDAGYPFQINGVLDADFIRTYGVVFLDDIDFPAHTLPPLLTTFSAAA